MKPAKEYSILPQCERDGGYIIRPENDPVKKKSCVLISFVILAVLIIVFGSLALVIGLFYSQEFTSTVNTYWNTKNHSNLSSSNTTTSGGVVQLPVGELAGTSSKNTLVQNETMTIPSLTTTPPEVANSNDHSSSSSDEGANGDEQTTAAETNDTNADKSVPKTTEKPTIPVPADTDTDEQDEEEDDSKEIDEDTDDDIELTTAAPVTTTTTVAPKKTTEHSTKKKSKHPMSSKHNSTKQEIDRQEEFAETMQEVEKYFETVTGIRRAEFVIPLLMLLVFVIALALSSCCCYLIIKRKDKQRRKVLGKMITDLQAGDKGILLDHDMDE